MFSDSREINHVGNTHGVPIVNLVISNRGLLEVSSNLINLVVGAVGLGGFSGLKLGNLLLGGFDVLKRISGDF